MIWVLIFIILFKIALCYPVYSVIELLMRLVRFQRMSLIINIFEEDPGVVSLIPFKFLLAIMINQGSIKAFFISERSHLTIIVPLSFI
jgi:hypothetical protein